MKTVEDLVLTYYSSNDFSMLRDKSKKDYQYFLNILVGEFGSVAYDKLSSKQAKHAYEEWVKRGVPWSGAGSEKNPLSNGSESIAERIAAAEKSHWSFQPILRYEPSALFEELPVHLRENWSRNRGGIRSNSGFVTPPKRNLQ